MCDECWAPGRAEARSLRSRRPLAEDNSDSLSPPFVNAYEYPINLGRDIAQHDVGRGMNVQGRGDQEEQRSLLGQLPASKVSELQELRALVVPLHARPIIQALQGQMNIFIGL